MGKTPVILILLSIGLVGAVFSQETTKPAPKGDVTRGKQVFENSCEECHDAYSREERVGPGLQGAKGGKLPDGRPASHDKLLDIINTGPAEMPSFKDRLTEQQKEDVVAFVMTL